MNDVSDDAYEDVIDNRVYGDDEADVGYEVKIGDVDVTLF